MRILLRAASLTIVISTVGVAAPAYAAGRTATSTTVTARMPTVYSGRPAAFRAQVSPTKVGKTKITGSFTWTVTGHDGTVIPCSSASPLNNGGKSTCKFFKATLLAAASPLTMTAAYSGDAIFAASSDSTTRIATAAPRK